MQIVSNSSPHPGEGLGDDGTGGLTGTAGSLQESAAPLRPPLQLIGRSCPEGIRCDQHHLQLHTTGIESCLCKRSERCMGMPFRKVLSNFRSFL